MRVATHPRFDRTRQQRRAKFRYSSYWQSWSLVLTDRCDAKPGYGPSVEIDLTTPSADLARLLRINVRRHCTAPDLRDHFADDLPAHVVAQIRIVFGRKLATWLLDPNTEILGKINWDAYRDNSNGGAALHDVIYPRYRDDVPTPQVDLASAG